MSRKLKNASFYLLLLLIEAPIIWLFVHGRSPVNHPLNTYWFVLSFLALLIISLPFFIIAQVGNFKLQVVGRSTLIWIFLLPIPLLIHATQLPNSKMVIYFVETLIGIYIILFYKIPYSFIILALILPGISNLYFLLYGSLKQNKL